MIPGTCFIELDGNLALRSGYPRAHWDRPVMTVVIWNSGIRITEMNQHYLTSSILYIMDDIATIKYENGGEGRLSIAGWGQGAVIQETPIPQPRNGKTYTWSYERGQWRKEEFPLCSTCYALHDPTLPECEECGYHHKPGRHVQRRNFSLIPVKEY